MVSVERKEIKRVLISTYDKTGISEVGTYLQNLGVEIIATGSTAQTLVAAGIQVTEVSAYTGFPEILGGRVKTLHPRIHGGLLADHTNKDHQTEIAALDITPFDLVIVSLYPFVETVATRSKFHECIEQIDIGGPAMLRAAAKNHQSVAVISDISQYPLLRAALQRGGFTLEERRHLALHAFRRTAKYDLQIATWLGEHDGESDFPDWFGRMWKKQKTLRYGENPHQAAALYSDGDAGIVGAQQLHGKEMSFNNYADAEAAWRSVTDHAQPCVAIIKHANPCGIALGESISDAYQRAHACDPVSAFGGVVAANRTITREMAEKLTPIFTEVVIAPDYEAAAQELLSKKPSIRLLKMKAQESSPHEIRPLSGGVLIQERDRVDADGDDPKNWRKVSGPDLSADLMADLVFAWRTIRSVKSNAVVIAHERAAIGIGMGQVNRVDASRLAVERAKERSRGAVAASDAFFPFADGVEILIDAGVLAIVQPGGSVRDDEVITAAEAAGITMFFTGVRHFSHA